MDNTRFRTGAVSPEESVRLREGLGVLLATARRSRGLSIRGTGRAAGLAASTVLRLEQGLRRPRVSTLARLALVLAAEASEVLAEQLRAAAGPSMVVDTPRSLTRQRRAATLVV